MYLVYGLYFAKLDKIYIGRTKNPKSRLQAHLFNLENDKHVNSTLQDCYNSYGQPRILPLAKCGTERDSKILERKYYDKYMGRLLNEVRPVKVL